MALRKFLCQRIEMGTSASALHSLLLPALRSYPKSKTWGLRNLPSTLCASCSVRHLSVLDVQASFKDYEYERRRFRLVAPEHFNFARDIIDVWASAEKSGIRDTRVPALWWIDDTGAELTYTFSDLSQLSQKIANVLTGACKLKPKDRVIVILPRVPEWWLITFRAGIVLSPGTTLLRTKDIQLRLRSSRAKCIIADANTVEFVEQACSDHPYPVQKLFVGASADTRPEWLNFRDLLARSTNTFQTVNTAASDPMMLYFTSGTTGLPKMTEHTQASYGLGHLVTARYLLQAGPTDVVWNLSDPGWAKCAWSSFFAPWLHGACVFTFNATKFDPQDTLKVLNRYPISHLCTPPTAKRLLVKEKLSNVKMPYLRHTICAGEPVNPELMDAWKEGTGLDIYEGYGQTETTLLCARYPCIPYRPGSMGKAAPGIDLQVIDDDGIPVSTGQEGNVGVRWRPHRPVGLFSCYVDEPERTKSVFQGDFYLTGDRAYVDDDGYFWFVGRGDDVINSAGYRIGPFEVESALLEHPAVLESAVVSSPDGVRGEIVKAFVILTPQYRTADLVALTSELQTHVKTVTAPYKYPRKIEFVDSLPKTISGKIRRVELRETEWKKQKTQ